MARRLIGAAFEMGVAETAIAALQKQHAFAGLRQIADQGFAVFFQNLGARGHAHDRIVTAGARHILAHAGQTVFGADMLLIAVVDQGVEIVHRHGPDIAAAAAIAAIGAAKFDELLTPEGDATIAAIAGANVDLGFVEEFHAASFRVRTFAPARTVRHPMHQHPPQAPLAPDRSSDAGHKSGVSGRMVNLVMQRLQIFWCARNSLAPA